MAEVDRRHLVARVDRVHTDPYLAGTSKDRKTLYIDRRLPKQITIRGGSSGFVTIDPAKPLGVHEETERDQMALGLPYELAHDKALKAERKCVEKLGGDWNSYQRVMHKAADIDEKAPGDDAPKDLFVVDQDEASDIKRGER